MRASTILFGLAAATFASAAVIPKEAATVKTAVSPDGYVYNVETEAYIEDTITTADRTTHIVLVHPAFKRSADEHGTSPNPNKSKRLQYTAGGADQCDHSTLVNKTSGASPTTGDCGAVRDYYRRDNGHFEASALLDLLGSKWCRLVITGTCVFGIKSKNVGGTKVGSSNIADLVEVSINTYQSGGRIGAEGGNKLRRLEGHDSVGYLPLLGGLQGEGLRSDASHVFVPFFFLMGMVWIAMDMRTRGRFVVT